MDDKKITDKDRIDFIGSLDQNVCQLLAPKGIVEKNLTNVRDVIDCCIELHGEEKGEE